MDKLKPLVLAIDDERFVRRSIRYFLEDIHYEVIEAENGPQGLALFVERAPQLVLLDLRMPEIDGLDVLAEIANGSPETPVIVISGNGAMNDVVEALRLGAWDYLIKPIDDLTMLEHAIGKALERARLMAENRLYRDRLEELVTHRTQQLEEANRELAGLIQRQVRVGETTRRISKFSRSNCFGSRLLEEFGKHMSAHGGSLYLLEQDRFSLVHSLDPGHAKPYIPLPPPTDSVLYLAYSTGKPLIIDDINHLSGCRRSGWEGYQNGSALAFPLAGDQGYIAGMIFLHAGKGKRFSKQDLEIGAVLAAYSSEALAVSRMMAALRESEERKELALQGANLGMWDWDVPSGKMVFDRRSEEMLGYEQGTINPHVDTWEAHVHPGDLDLARNVLDIHLEGKTSYFECTYRVVRQSGEVRWVSDRGRVVSRSEKGEAIRVTGTHLDITVGKQAELDLRESEERLRSIIDNNPVPMIITDGNKVEYINRAFEEQMGYGLGDIEVMELFWKLAFPNPDRRQKTQESWLNARYGDTVAPILEDWRITHSNGSKRDVEVKLMVLGKLTVTALNDVTERKRAELHIRELNRDLETRVETSSAQLEAAREELVDATQRAGMADIATGTIHNIGNILSSVNVSTEEVKSHLDNSKIRGLLKANQLLLEHENDLADFLINDSKGKQIPKYFLALGQKINAEHNQIKQEVASLNNQIDIMRDVITTQQTYARQVNNTEKMAVVDLVEHALKLQKHSLERYNVTIKRIFNENPDGFFSRVKLTHILINLIKNAAEASFCVPYPHNEISIELGTNSESVKIIVRDNGCGIDQQNMDKIFTYGFTTKEDGHGFGLHTCARWLEDLGGSLTVSSMGLGQGAAFTMCFPLSKPNQE